jgi:hypothetical protein
MMHQVWCAWHGGWVPVVVIPDTSPWGNFAQHTYRPIYGGKESCWGSRQIVTHDSRVRKVPWIKGGA